MARIITDVSNFLTLLSSEKATERKQGASKLEVLLKDRETISILDRYSNSKKSSQQVITWDTVVHRISKFLLKEYDNGNSTKIKDAANFYQYSIQVAEKRGTLLKGSLVFSQLSYILSKNDPYLISICSNILKKYILTKRYHRVEFTGSKWHEFVEFYCQLIPEISSTNQVLQYATILHELFKFADCMPYVEVDVAFKFFHEIFLKYRSEKNTALLEELISSLNIFLRLTVQDWRHRVDEIIEKLHSCFLHYFHSSIKYNVQSLKYKMSELFTLWIENHLPLQQHLDEANLDISNKQKWLDYMNRLYDVIQIDIDQLHSKVFQTNCDDDSKAFYHLSALVLNQIMLFGIEKSSVVNASDDRPNKRRRLNEQLPYKNVLLKISMMPDSNSTITWMNMLKILLNHKEDWKVNYLVAEEIYTLIETILPNLKNNAIIEASLRLLIEVIKSFPKHEIDNKNNNSNVCQKYRQICEYSIKLVRSKKHESLCFTLLKEIWKTGYQDHNSHIYRFYTIEATIVPSRHTVELLCQIMKSCYFPEGMHYEFMNNIEDDDLMKKFPLRRQLFNWLLPKKNEAINKYQLLKLTDINLAKIWSYVLISLLSVSPVNMIQSLPSCVPINLKKENLNRKDITNIHFVTKVVDSNASHSTLSRKYKTNPNVEQFFVKRVDKIYTEILDCCGKKPSSVDESIMLLEDVSHLFTFNFHMLLNLYNLTGVNHLISKLKQYNNIIMKRLFNLLMFVFKSEHNLKVPAICSCLEKLEQLVICNIKGLNSVFQVEFIELLKHIMNGEGLITTSMPHGAYNKKANLGNDDFMELDDDSPSETDSPILNQEEHPLKSNNYEKKLCMVSLNILTHLFMHTTDKKEERLTFVQLLKEKIKENHTQISMLISFMRIMEDYSYKLAADELLIMLNCMKNAFSSYQNDQDVCESLLQSILYLIEQLKNTVSTENVSEQARLLLVKILGVFCSLRTEKYSPNVRKVLVTAIAVIAEINDCDGMWKLEIKNQNNEPSLASATSLLCQLMLDGCMMVRMHAINSIKFMFNGKSCSDQTKAYSYLKNIFKKFHKNKKSSAEEENRDQIENRNVMIQLIAKQILCHVFLFDKQTLWVLWEFVVKGILQQKEVFQVVEAASNHLGYDDISSYFDTRIDYLLNEYIKRKYPIVDFPSGCMNMTQHELFSAYYERMIPYIILYKAYGAVKEIQHEIQLDLQVMLTRCLPNVVVVTFPAYYKQLQGVELCEEDQLVLQCLQYYQKLIPEVFNKELQLQFPTIFKELFLHVFDGNGRTFISSKYTSETDYYSFYPPLSSEVVGNILTSIASCYSETTTVISVFSKNVENIPYLLSSLSIYVSKPSVYTEQLNFMKAYYCFLVLLLKNFESLEKTCGNYIINEVIHRLVYFIQMDEGTHISHICFDLLDTIFKKVTHSSCILKEASKNLNFVMTSLQYHILNNTNKTPRTKRLFQIIILNLSEQENLGELKEALCGIDLFPPHADVNELNNKLLLIRSMENPFHQREEIQRISKNLSVVKHPTSCQLDTLINVLKVNVKLHNDDACRIKELIKKFFHLFSKLKTEQKVMLVECFGLVGPSILTTNNNEEEKLKETISPLPDQYHHFILIEMLMQYTLDERFKLASVALECLLKTLSTFKTSNIAPLKYLDSFIYVMPFLKGKKMKNQFTQEQLLLSLQELQSGLLEADLSIHYKSAAKHWIVRLVTEILTHKSLLDPLFEHFLPMCQISSDFSKKCFPYLIESILRNHGDFKMVITTVLNQWVSSSLDYLKDNHLNKELLEKLSVIVDLVQFLRCLDDTDACLKTKTCWDNKFHLSLNYLKLAEIATICSAFYPAALFAEIHLDPILLKQTKSESSHSNTPSEPCRGGSLESTVAGTEELTPSERTSWQELVFRVYKNIGEKDIIYGLDTSFLSFEKKRLQSYQLEKDFTKALVTNDITSGCQGQLLINGLLESSLHNTAYLCAKGLCETHSDEFSELQFESAWKNSIWDDVNTSSVYRRGYHGNIHNCLSAIRYDDAILFEKYIEDLKYSVIDIMSEDDFSSFRYKEFLSKCVTIRQLENTGNFILRDVAMSTDIKEIKDEFHLYDESLNVTMQALKIGCVSSQKKGGVAQVLLDHLQNYSKLAHHAKRFQICERIMHEVHEVRTLGFQVDCNWQIEEAKLYWTRDEKMHAVFRLKSLLNEMESAFNDDSAIYPIALSLYGHWLGETKSKNPAAIMEDYLEPAIEIMEGDSYIGIHSPVDAYHSLAKFADEQYQSILDYIKSPGFCNRQAVIKKSKIDAMKNSNESLKSKDMVVKRYYMNLNKQCEEDEKELEKLVADKKSFLKKAVKYYCKCLELDKKYELKILRLCSLWFTNYSEEDIAHEIQDDFSRIKSENFLLVMYQLAARLGTNITKSCLFFKQILEQIIIRCINDHPHHSLFILLALCNANVDQRILAKSASSTRTKLSNKSNPTEKIDKVRIEAAKEVLEKVRETNHELVQSAEQLASSYIELAYWDVTHLKKEKGPIQIQSNKMITKVQDLKCLAVPTAELPIDPSCQYKNIVQIVRFDNHFSLAGGVNLPKIISCVGSDGKKWKQLVKGRDDLRQDAVMQQVFGVVNKLLTNNRETKSLDLKMRTYKVVPLSKNSGLLQWCDGTIPLGNYLVNGQGGVMGAHQRYNPKDWTASECRGKLSKASGDEGPKSKYNVFKGIQNNFHPVFRYFFLEKFKDADVWFKRKLNYTSSTAVCSIVGYIVGLGDRHCQNILIDCNTADMIHIDLGVAFEQGKLLPTPETIPFRLTRDIVDGMGVAGIEGVYRRCCEKTLKVLQDSKEALITIVEVLLYDPLSQWDISAEKARKLQRESSKIDSDSCLVLLPTQRDQQATNDDSDKNKAAERVLVRLEQKLTGYEDHTYLGYQGQVNYLIQEARSTRNLCKLFVGWQPWL